jgi:hypothetical protein
MIVECFVWLIEVTNSYKHFFLPLWWMGAAIAGESGCCHRMAIGCKAASI